MHKLAISKGDTKAVSFIGAQATVDPQTGAIAANKDDDD
jgi:hypothetical protein